MAEVDETRLLERLVADPEFRAHFRRDPVTAAREAGFAGLADELARSGGDPMQTLDGRESRSSVAGALMAAVVEGIGIYEVGHRLLGVEDAQAATTPVGAESAAALADQAPPPPPAPVVEGNRYPALTAEQVAADRASRAAASQALLEARAPPAGAPTAESVDQWDGSQFGQAGPGGPPTAETLALLNNDHVVFDADGVADLQAGRIDPRVVAVLGELGEKHTIEVSSMSADHPQLTTAGSTSNHYYGRAVDIASVDGRPVGPGNLAARRLAVALAGLDPSIRPSEIGSPWQLPGSAYFTDGAHQDHLHVAFDGPIQENWRPPGSAAATAPAESAPAGATDEPASRSAASAAALSTDPDDLEGNLDDEDAGADEKDGSNEDEPDEGGGEDDDGGADSEEGSDDGESGDEEGSGDGESDDEEGPGRESDDEEDSDDEDEPDEEEPDEDESDDDQDAPGEGSNGEDADDASFDGSSSDDGDSGDESPDGSSSDDEGSDDGDSDDESSDGGGSDDPDDSGTSGDESAGTDAANLDLQDVDPDYPGDDAPREQVAAWMASAAEKRGLPPELPVMAGLTESGLSNLDHGDADSVGFFQMRLSIWNQGPYSGYADQPERQLQWFLDQAEAVKKQRLDRGLPVDDPNQYGEWIADVERPAAQYRGRYQLRLDEAHDLLARHAQPSGDDGDLQEVADAAGEPQAGQQALVALAEAKKYLGTPYLWGGSSPKTGFDCSGLVQWAYAHAGIRIPRVTDQQILAPGGVAVGRQELLPGDLVFFRDSSGYVHHVGISLGGDKFLHAPHTGDVVKVSSLSEPYYAREFTGGRRFDAPELEPALPRVASAAQVAEQRAQAAERRSELAERRAQAEAIRIARAALERDAAEVQRPGTALFRALERQEGANDTP